MNISRSENKLVSIAQTAELKLSRRKILFLMRVVIVIQARSALKSFANAATLVKDIDEVCVWFAVGFFFPPHCCSCSGKIPGDSVDAIMPAKLRF